MLDFLTKNNVFITYGVEILAAIVGLLCLRKYKNTTVKYFIWFLVYVVFVEVIGYLLSYFRNSEALLFLKNNGFGKFNWWYTIFWSIGSIMFYVFYYSRISKIGMFKLLYDIIGIVFLVSSIAYIGFNFEAFLSTFPFYFQVAGAFVTVTCVAIYFIELLLSEKLLKFYKSFNFYLSLTILVWWIIITPLVFFDEYNTVNDWNYVNLKRQIFLFANIFMYLTFTFNLLWCKPQSV